jgi:DNA polymerase-3 subunit delta
MPAVTPEQLLTRLSKGKPIPGILLLGSDSYLRGRCRKKITETYVAEASRDWGIKRFSAADDDFSDILGQAQTLPMLAPRQVIFVSDVEAWERLGDDSRDALVKELSEYLGNPAPFTILVFESVELDQRMRLAKTLAEKTVTVSVELSKDPVERTRQSVQHAFEMARELGLEFEPGAGEELCEILDGQLAAIHTEIEKLASYAGDRRKILRTDVDLLVVSAQKYEVWALTDMLGAREPSRALAFLDNLLREGEEPVRVLGALAWM